LVLYDQLLVGNNVCFRHWKTPLPLYVSILACRSLAQ
jgi:hypothetical protein